MTSRHRQSNESREEVNYSLEPESSFLGVMGPRVLGGGIYSRI